MILLKGYDVQRIYIQTSENGCSPPLFIHKASKDGIEIKIVTNNDWDVEEFIVDIEYDSEFIIDEVLWKRKYKWQLKVFLKIVVIHKFKNI